MHNSTSELAEASHHVLDNVGSIQDLSETPESQNDDQDLDGDATLRLYITGKFEMTTETSYLEHLLSQTLNFNAQRKGLIFRTSIQSGLPLLVLLPGTRGFGC